MHRAQVAAKFRSARRPRRKRRLFYPLERSQVPDLPMQNSHHLAELMAPKPLLQLDKTAGLRQNGVSKARKSRRFLPHPDTHIRVL
jgi:hypothetical protein